MVLATCSIREAAILSGYSKEDAIAIGIVAFVKSMRIPDEKLGRYGELFIHTLSNRPNWELPVAVGRRLLDDEVYKSEMQDAYAKMRG